MRADTWLLHENLQPLAGRQDKLAQVYFCRFCCDRLAHFVRLIELHYCKIHFHYRIWLHVLPCVGKRQARKRTGRIVDFYSALSVRNLGSHSHLHEVR